MFMRLLHRMPDTFVHPPNWSTGPHSAHRNSAGERFSASLLDFSARFGLAIFSNNRGSDYGGGGFPSSLRHDKGPEKCAASARGQRQSRKMDFSISYIEEFFVALSTDYLIRK